MSITKLGISRVTFSDERSTLALANLLRNKTILQSFSFFDCYFDFALGVTKLSEILIECHLRPHDSLRFLDISRASINGDGSGGSDGVKAFMKAVEKSHLEGLTLRNLDFDDEIQVWLESIPNVKVKTLLLRF